jgi:hypothetical protein
MTRKLNIKMIAGCSVLALTATMANHANAFDEVNWIWNADVVTTVDTSATAVTELEPTGLNQAENEQEMRGNISSSSSVNDFSSLLDVDVLDLVTDAELPAIETSSQAMGNSASIDSAVQINFDSVQIFGGVEPDTIGMVSANSEAVTVIDASVDSSATAVVNSLTVDLDYTTDADALSIGNNVQSAMADVSAVSAVEAVTIAGLSVLGGADSPAISSAATAVGNNFSASVGPAIADVTALPDPGSLLP